MAKVKIDGKKIAIAVTIIIVLILLWYFLVYKPRKAQEEETHSHEPSKASSGGSGSGGSKPSGVSQADRYAALPNGSLPLKKGDENKLVWLLQTALNQLKGSGLNVDGEFGERTESALYKAYKVKSVDDSVAKRIYAEYATKAQQDKKYAQMADTLKNLLGA